MEKMEKTEHIKPKSVKIKSCTCSHKFQDRVYGKGMRVHNVMHSSFDNKRCRCTVCKTER